MEQGGEETPEQYVAGMVEVFREVRRVLRDDGTLWVNIGDSYNGGGPHHGPNNIGNVGAQQNGSRAGGTDRTVPGLKPKDLVGIPWRLAFALQADGWWLRQDIIWAKSNPMPESVTDRCTKAHEYLFLLTKSARYFFDQEAIKEKTECVQGPRPFGGAGNGKQNKDRHDYMYEGDTGTRNRRSVWTIATEPSSIPHFAMAPTALVRPCVLAGCPAKVCAKCGAPWERTMERIACPRNRDITDGADDPPGRVGNGRSGRQDLSGAKHAAWKAAHPDQATGYAPTCTCNADTIPGTVLDCFGGAGTTAVVAMREGRNAIVIELNPANAAIARARCDRYWARDERPAEEKTDARQPMLLEFAP